jgi:two-component system cell cycle sensor histidine kinase/response regulator CckA
MTTGATPPASDGELRRRAEALKPGDPATLAGPAPGMAAAAAELLVHELRVHQIELDLQNEELGRAQVELGLSRARYFDLFDLAPVGYCILTTAGVVQEANLTAATLLGVNRHSLVKRPISHFVLRDDHGLYFHHHHQLLDTGGEQTFTLRLVRRDGSWFWARMGVTAARDLDGAQVHRLAIVDVSALKQAEERALLAQARQEAFFQCASDGMFIADLATGNLLAANPQAGILVGRPCPELVGLHHLLLHPADLHEELRAAFGRCAAGAALPVETEVLHRDGSRIPVEIAASLVPVPGGAAQLLGIFRDIRERVRLQEQLRQSEKLCALGQLAGGIAHDFNNQLAAVTGCAELLATALTEPRQRGWAETILDASRRSGDLIRQLLAFARKGQSLRSPIDLQRTITEVAHLLRQGLDPRIALVLAPGDLRCLTLGDPSQVKDALLNLALNAREAMPDGGTLSFALRTVVLDADRGGYGNAAGRFAAVTVGDTGRGMDAKIRRHLFEPFFTTKAPGAGPGLGLAAVYGVVRNHGGAIAVASAPGQGTTITLHFPLFIPEVAAAPAQPLAATGPPGAARRILVVDDEAMVRDITAEMLRCLGHQAETSPDAADALARCRERPPFDLVMLDMVMPGIGGYEAFTALRAAQPGLRVVIFSGHSLNGEVQSILDLGALGFLQKPFRMADLARAVGAALAAAPAGIGDPPAHQPQEVAS